MANIKNNDKIELTYSVETGSFYYINGAGALEVFPVGGSLSTALQGSSLTLAKATVTQATSITTAVTINARQGVITTVTPNISAGSSIAFVMNNSEIDTDSIILFSGHLSGIFETAEAQFNYLTYSGGTTIYIKNTHATEALTVPLKIHFMIS
jgi:hypothetical protein